MTEAQRKGLEAGRTGRPRVLVYSLDADCPLNRVPAPMHHAKRHVGWRKWCALCVEWKAYTDRVTKTVTAWPQYGRRGQLTPDA